MRWVRSLISVLLILVMLGSVISPALAVDAEQKACPSCSKVITGKSKVTVIELNGIEKDEILAKALKNEDVKKLIRVLVKKGYEQKIAKARVIKIYTRYGTALLVIIPFDTKNSNKMAGVVLATSDGYTEAYAIELQKKRDTIHKEIYYFDPKGNLQVITSTEGFLSCLWACIGWDIPACALTCAACQPETVAGILACLACAACVGKGACCVGKCGKQEWGDPFCAAIDIQCQLGNWVACVVYLGCEGYC